MAPDHRPMLRPRVRAGSSQSAGHYLNLDQRLQFFIAHPCRCGTHSNPFAPSPPPTPHPSQQNVCAVPPPPPPSCNCRHADKLHEEVRYLQFTLAQFLGFLEVVRRESPRERPFLQAGNPQGSDTLSTLVEGVRFVLTASPTYLEEWWVWPSRGLLRCRGPGATRVRGPGKANNRTIESNASLARPPSGWLQVPGGPQPDPPGGSAAEDS
jgi:hypothetical protein